MAFLTWTDQHKSNVKAIDDQHKKLFDMLNRLHASTVQGAEQSELTAILDDMIEYTVEHFATEETLFADHAYPGFVDHKREHDDLTRQAVGLQEQFRDGSATISFELLEFLHDWLVDHTLGTDKDAGAFLNSKGVF